jgi:hypothetical protein
MWLYAVSGLSALAWFLVRVVPKPSRAAYPCQRLAMPVASSFVMWVIGLTGALYAFRAARRQVVRARYALATACMLTGIAVGVWALSIPGEPAGAAFSPSEGPNAPMGTGKGIHPGRVVWVHDPDATSWNGSSNYWWSQGNTDQAVVDEMMAKSIRWLAGQPTDAAAWDAIFRNFNETHGRGAVGYVAGEKIAIKINQNVTPGYGATNKQFTAPELMRALLWQLVYQAGVPQDRITVYEASRCIPHAIFDYCRTGNETLPAFDQVRFVDNDGGGARDDVERNGGVEIVYSKDIGGDNAPMNVPECVGEATYLINLALLRGHSLGGVTLCAKNHFGSVYDPERSTQDGGWKPSRLHNTMGRSRSLTDYNCLVDLMGHEHLDGKAVLFMIDGLYASKNQGEATPIKWGMAPFNNDWTSSLFVSQDGVAMDSVGLDFCRSEAKLSDVTGNPDNYLHEAALAHDPPSKTVYDPEGDGTPLASLGVHEHWNNATEKQYSRNLGIGDGIELVTGPTVTSGVFTRGDANADGGTDISDAVSILLHLFGRGPAPSCESAADTNDTGGVDLADAVYLLQYLFTGGSVPPAPFGACGTDALTPDDLTCESFPPCP